MVEDNGAGFVLEDMNTRQLTPIIKSILTNIIGKIKVYDSAIKEELQLKVGEKLNKFWSLIAQAIQNKDPANKHYACKFAV